MLEWYLLGVRIVVSMGNKAKVFRPVIVKSGIAGVEWALSTRFIPSWSFRKTRFPLGYVANRS